MTTRCSECLCAKTSKNVVFGTGNEEAAIFSIGEAPGPDEDAQGLPFIGRAGKVYDKFLLEAKLERKDIWTDNTVKCFPGYDKEKHIQKPSPDAIITCSKLWLFPTLEAIKPRAILTWGSTATANMLGKSVAIGKVIGQEFETQYGIVIPLYHPAYFLRNPADYTAWRKNVDGIVRAKQLVGLSDIGSYTEQKKVEHHQDDKAVISTLTANSGVFEDHPWNKERIYFTAWTDKRDIVLVYKDEQGKLQEERIKDFKWYFYLKTEDVINLGDTFWESFLADDTVFGFEIDPINNKWTMVYADRQIIRSRALREHLLEGGTSIWHDRQIEKYEADQRLRALYDALDAKGIIHYEGDLPPLRRFMTDYDINISTAYNELYVDIETDDTLPLGNRDTLSQRRILSIAYELHFSDKTKEPEVAQMLLKAETDAAEKKLLEDFIKVMAKADILYAWNGNGFDFPILRDRMWMHNLRCRWDYIQVIDLLRTWFRYFTRGAAINTSYSLQNIARHVLKQDKIDWREKALEQGKKITRMLQLYRQAPDILLEYNADDVHKMVELEKFMGFAKIDQLFCRIGNCFPRDYHISTKIDALLLKRGKYAGVHFKSWRGVIMGADSGRRRDAGSNKLKKSEKSKNESYTGGYVLVPERGLHTNVAALDFKALYPSVMVAFNISPEIHVPPEEIPNHDPKDLITCPSGTTFLREPAGFIPTIFKHTGERRKIYQKLQGEQEVGSDLFLLYYRLAYSFKRLGLSFYGEMGNAASRYYNTRVAEAVTKSGQYLLRKSIELAAEKGWKPLYGDSVLGDSIIQIDKKPWKIQDFWDHVVPLGIQKRGEKEIVDLSKINYKITAGKIGNGRWNKPRLWQTFDNLEAIIRHKTQKRLFEITTANGHKLTVTEDHSLIVKRNSEYIEVSPLDIQSDDIIYSWKKGDGHIGGWKKAKKVFKQFRDGPNISQETAVKRGQKIGLALRTYFRTNPGMGHENRLKQQVPITDTKPEREFEQLIRKLGYPFKMHCVIKKNGFGCRPDFQFQKQKLVVFIDGNYWHAHPEQYSPESLNETQKHNRQVDAIQRKWLVKQGWQVRRFWESEILQNPSAVVQRLKRYLNACS